MPNKFDNSRGFLLLTYKLYGFFNNKVSGVVKGNCINVYLSLMKYAWKTNNYKCAVRYSTIAKDTCCSKMTVRRTINTLAKLNIISVKRLPSANEYQINTIFLRSEGVSKVNTHYARGYKSEHSGGIKLNTINRNINNINIDRSSNEVSKIVSSNMGDKNIMIDKLSKLPLEDLKNDTVNVYYCKLAIERKEEVARENNANFVPPQKIIEELTKIKKMTNPRYREKVSFNKRNNLDWRGKPIVKDDKFSTVRGKPKK